MQLKLFIVPLKNADPAEQEMNGFLRSHRVLAVKKEFVSDGENSFWTQQQRAGKSQQQSRLPLCPSSAGLPAGSGLTRPASRPSRPATSLANSSAPPGASRASENSGRPLRQTTT